MRTSFRTLSIAAGVVVALAAVPALHAQPKSSNPQEAHGMMQGGDTGMMNMMQQIGRMMERCDNMMKDVHETQDRPKLEEPRRAPGS